MIVRCVARHQVATEAVTEMHDLAVVDLGGSQREIDHRAQNVFPIWAASAYRRPDSRLAPARLHRELAALGRPVGPLLYRLLEKSLRRLLVFWDTVAMREWAP